MGPKYVGGMILEFVTRAGTPSICTQTAQTHNLKKKFRKKLFFQFFKKSKGLECAIWLHAWGGHSGMLKTHL